MEKLVNKTVDLDLVGIDGNAWSILGYFRREAKRQGWSNDEIDIVSKQATSGNYDNLLATIMMYIED